MKLEKIITLANSSHRLRFTLMERSLRAVGCTLPILVIPYDDDVRFEIPTNSEWWLDDKISHWAEGEKASPRKRKYQCLTTSNYHFVDTDILFLKNPETVFDELDGFITSCNHWTFAETARVITASSKKIMLEKTTLWQKNVFCSGQFACDRVLYSADDLIKTAMMPDHVSTCVRPPYGDQEGLNLLVFLSGVSVNNLTLPPFNMESTWIGDYEGNPTKYWATESRKPYLLHCYCYTHKLHEEREVNWLFRELLSKSEQNEWKEQATKWLSAQEIWDAERSAFHSKSKMAKLVGRLTRAGSVLRKGYY